MIPITIIGWDLWLGSFIEFDNLSRAKYSSPNIKPDVALVLKIAGKKNSSGLLFLFIVHL